MPDVSNTLTTDTLQHIGSFNGTGNSNQTLTLAGGSANVLAVGDRLCAVMTDGSNWVNGTGNGGITVTVRAV